MKAAQEDGRFRNAKFCESEVGCVTSQSGGGWVGSEPRPRRNNPFFVALSRAWKTITKLLATNAHTLDYPRTRVVFHPDFSQRSRVFAAARFQLYFICLKTHGRLGGCPNFFNISTASVDLILGFRQRMNATSSSNLDHIFGLSRLPSRSFPRSIKNSLLSSLAAR
jgi:hypothetical protein